MSAARCGSLLVGGNLPYLVGVVMVTCVGLGWSIRNAVALCALSAAGAAGAANTAGAPDTVPVSSCRQRSEKTEVNSGRP